MLFVDCIKKGKLYMQQCWKFVPLDMCIVPDWHLILPKIFMFQPKIFIFFSVLNKTICHGYSLEAHNKALLMSAHSIIAT